MQTKEATHRGGGPPGAGAWSLKRWAAWIAPAVLILVSIGVAFLWLGDRPLNEAAYRGLQRDWFLALNGRLSAVPPRLWANVTRLGDGLVLFPILAGVMIWKPRTLVSVFGCMPAAIAFSRIGKELTQVERPPHALDPGTFTVIGRAWFGMDSLPSGHSIVFAAAASAILAVLVPAPRGWRQWLLIAAACSAVAVGCLSRVAVGVHWPLDVLAGGALGWLAGLSGAAVARTDRWHWERSLTAHRTFGAVLLVWSLVVLAWATVAHDDAPVLWLSGLCGALAALWLLRARPRSAAAPVLT